MMADTYTLISSVTVGAGGASSIDFTSIPATYTDLKLVYSLRQTSGASQAAYISFNGSTSSFSAIYLYGNGSSASSGSLARYAGSLPGTNFTNQANTNAEIYIPNYAGSNNKSYSVDNVDENNGTAADSNFIAGLWANTAAITSISLSSASGTFTQYSTAYLYGIKNS